MRSKLITAISLIGTFLVGGLLTYFVIIQPLTAKGVDTSLNGGSNNGVVQCANNVTLNENSISTSVGKIYDAVVMIGNYQNTKQLNTGSGFVYKTDDKYGYIMTNNHVVSGGNKVVVVMANDEEVGGEVLGGDSYLDLAVVQIPKSAVTKVAVIGKSEVSLLGDTVFTVGAPLGYEYRGSVTKGTLSGKNRLVAVSVSSADDWIMSVLQVDAAINPGNSGGPLLNINGEVIGVNSLKLVKDEIEGMGFAIPIEDAMQYIPTLESGKKVERPLIGISMINVTDTYLLYQNGIKINEELSEGVVVISTVDGSGASKAGLKKGDIITKIGNKTVKNAAYLKYELYKHSPGNSVEVTFLRDGKTESVKITLTKSE